MKSMSGFLLRILTGAFIVSLAAGCGGGNASFTQHGPSPSAHLVSIEVSPTNPSIALGTTKQFTATGIYSDHTSFDLTASVTWSSSSTAVSTISNTVGSQGLARAEAAGTTTITAASGTVSGSTTLNVRAASLLALDVSPAAARIALGTTRQFTATGIFSDNSTQDLTASVTWSSTSTTVATVSNTAGSRGLSAAVAAGSTLISATSGTFSGSAALTVSAASLLSLNVEPINPSIAPGTTKQFSATGIFSDNSNQDMTESVTWNSSSTAVSTISNTAASRGLASALAAGSTLISATSGTFSGSTTLAVKAATLVSINVSPAAPGIVLGASQPFTATGIYSDNSTQDLTASVTWSSSNTGVAAISNAAGSNGVATSVAAGSATITATSGSVSGSVMLTVRPASLVSLAVSPSDPAVAAGAKQQFTAMGTYSDSTTAELTASVVWSSSNSAVATVGNTTGSQGLATAVAAGSAVISATTGTYSAGTALAVTVATLSSIEVTPTNPSIALGSTRQFTATGIYSDDTRQDLTASVTWSSSNTAVTVISNAPGTNGLATSVAAGSAMIRATAGSVSGSTTLTVTSATLVSISLSPAAPSIALGTTRQFTAIGIYSDSSTQDLTASATWSSLNTAVAVISNAPGTNGLATSVAAGSAMIRATAGPVSGSTSLTVTSAVLQALDVTPAFTSVALGTQQQFIATGTYSDNTTADLTASVLWSSSSTTVAAISNAPGTNGQALSRGAGTATWTAVLAGLSGRTDLTVTSATLSSIEVAPAGQSIALGTTQQFSAIGIYSDNSMQDLTASVTWGSSDPMVAAISSAAGSSGLATSVGAGPATITASLAGISGSTDLTVTSATLVAIDVDPTDPGAIAGTTLQFTATGIFSDNSIQDLTATVSWTSSSTAVAAISNAPGSSGLAKALAAGTTAITAAAGGVAGSTTLTVSAAVLQSIDITPAAPTAVVGEPLQFTAIGTYSDDTTVDLTASVVWSSSSNSVATISNAPGTNGRAVPLGAGSTTLSATFAGVSGTTGLTVTAATLVSIQITPTDPTVPAGFTEEFSAAGLYSDGSTQDITDLVTWSSSNTAAATISNAAGSKGAAKAVAAGAAVITAALGGVSDTTTLTVSTATLSTFVISPATTQIARGTTRQFAATASFSDGSSFDVTTSAVWTSSNMTVATISNTSPTRGRATARAAGSVTITAAWNGTTATAALTVSTATFQTLVVSPTNISAPVRVPLQYTAIGNFSDGTRQDLTTQVTWRSSNTGVATISNSYATKGLASPMLIGTSTISASVRISGVTRSGSTGLTVTGAAIVRIDVSAYSSSTSTVPIVPPTVRVGNRIWFRATGVYSDGVTTDLTRSSSLTWSSSNTSVATISNTTARKGRATGVNVGTVTIRAQLVSSVSGTAPLTVTP